jgi:hypothetical protein
MNADSDGPKIKRIRPDDSPRSGCETMKESAEATPSVNREAEKSF